VRAERLACDALMCAQDVAAGCVPQTPHHFRVPLDIGEQDRAQRSDRCPESELRLLALGGQRFNGEEFPDGGAVCVRFGCDEARIRKAGRDCPHGGSVVERVLMAATRPQLRPGDEQRRSLDALKAVAHIGLPGGGDVGKEVFLTDALPDGGGIPSPRRDLRVPAPERERPDLGEHLPVFLGHPGQQRAPRRAPERLAIADRGLEQELRHAVRVSRRPGHRRHRRVCHREEHVPFGANRGRDRVYVREARFQRVVVRLAIRKAGAAGREARDPD